MTETLRRMSEEKTTGNQVPFDLIATAYRRKRLLGEVFECSNQSLASVVQQGVEEEQIEKERAKAAAKTRAEAGESKAGCALISA